jgi:hypothetical protein
MSGNLIYNYRLFDSMHDVHLHSCDDYQIDLVSFYFQMGRYFSGKLFSTVCVCNHLIFANYKKAY